jgi:hypothetical protein
MAAQRKATELATKRMRDPRVRTGHGLKGRCTTMYSQMHSPGLTIQADKNIC